MGRNKMKRLFTILSTTGLFLSFIGALFALLCLGSSVMSDAPGSAHQIFKYALPLPIAALSINTIVVIIAHKSKYSIQTLPVVIIPFIISILTILLASLGLISK